MREVQDALDVNYSIIITYLPSNDTVSFSGFIETFSDDYKQEWQSEPVYGRMDPIFFYKNTTRKISLKFEVPSESESDAKANFLKLQKLINFCYPTYESPTEKKTVTTPRDTTEIGRQLSDPGKTIGNSMLLSSPPLLAIKFANLISSDLPSGKLIVKIDGVKYSVDEHTNYYSTNGNLYTNKYSIDLSMDVLHSSPLGWEKDTGDKVKLRNKYFPYKF